MKRDRLATVLHLRELVERQRLAERAAAERQQAIAVQALGTARELRAETVIAPGTSLLPAQLSAHRAQAIALGDLVEVVEHKVEEAGHRCEAAREQQVTASVRRRSVERLRERRDALAAKADERREARRLDEVGLQVWRRSP